MYTCSEFYDRCADSSSSEEETTTRRRRHMEDESTIRTTPSMMYARGGAGVKASNGSGVKASKETGGSGGSVACGGSLEDCVAA